MTDWFRRHPIVVVLAGCALAGAALAVLVVVIGTSGW